MIEIALYQPDIAPNAGALARMCACFGLTLRIIAPAGFTMADSAFRRAGMDYLEQAVIHIDPSWAAFRQATARRRLVLLTTRGAVPHTAFTFQREDVLVLGRESSGVPEDVHAEAAARIRIPIRDGTRSLNVAMAGAIAAAEALRQLDGFAGHFEM